MSRFRTLQKTVSKSKHYFIDLQHIKCIFSQYLSKFSETYFEHPTYMGAWIETSYRCTTSWKDSASHPMRVRGLKRMGHQGRLTWWVVAPYAGAWIEIKMKAFSKHK